MKITETELALLLSVPLVEIMDNMRKSMQGNGKSEDKWVFEFQDIKFTISVEFKE